MKNSARIRLALYITVNFVLSAVLYITFPWLIVPTVLLFTVYMINRLLESKVSENQTPIVVPERF